MRFATLSCRPVFFASLIALSIAGATPVGAQSQTPAQTQAAVSAPALLLIEADSGKVLHAERATQPWYPASVTKLMTTYVTLKAVKAGRLSLDARLTVSENAAAQAPSKMGFRPGTQVTVDNAIKMLMVKSANDIAVVLAEGVAGSVEAFSGEMNQAARQLGMTQTTYVNPNGLPDEGQVTSARDIAILARAMIRELPEYDLYWHIPAIKLGKRVMRNYNTLIDRYPGADGMKTGFICASGFNLAASATRNGRRLIAVVLGAPSAPVRAVKAAQMLERGFNNGLSWLTPSLGSVDSLQPISADPPNLREDMCGKHRKRPAAESEDADDNSSVNVDSGSPHALSLANLRGDTSKPSTLLGPPVRTMDPIVVFASVPKKAGDSQAAAKSNKRDTSSDTKPQAKSAAAPKAQSASPSAAKSRTATPKAKSESKSESKSEPKAAATAAKPAASANSKSQAGKPQSIKPEIAKPEVAKPTTKPQNGKPETAKPQAANTARPAAEAAKPAARPVAQ